MSFFTKKIIPDSSTDYLAGIGADLHVHVLPGIDDGSPSLAESLEILKNHYNAGLRRIVATPHIRSDFFPNTEATIRGAWQLLQEAAAERWPDLTLTYAAEHYGDDYLMTLLERDEILPLFDRYVLVETSMRVELPYFTEVLRAMIDRNWQPVLAHPERYRPWHEHPDRYAELHEMGVTFQINLLSLGGQYGIVEQSIAERLIRQGWAGAAGTDLHRASQYGYLRRAAQNPVFPMLCDLPLLNHQVPEYEERR